MRLPSTALFISTAWPLPLSALQWQDITVYRPIYSHTATKWEGISSITLQLGEKHKHVNIQRGSEWGMDIQFQKKRMMRGWWELEAMMEGWKEDVGWERPGLSDDVPSHLCIIYMCIHHVTAVVTQIRDSAEKLLNSVKPLLHSAPMKNWTELKCAIFIEC